MSLSLNNNSKFKEDNNFDKYESMKLNREEKRMSQIKDFNRIIAQVAPELDAKYGRYPISFKEWLHPRESISGQPCFIESSTDTGMKENYVFGNGVAGSGYYHLLTKVAYKNLYERLECEKPLPACCLFLKTDAAKAYNNHEKVKHLIEARQSCFEPNDISSNKNMQVRRQSLRDERHSRVQRNYAIVAGNTAVSYVASASVALSF